MSMDRLIEPTIQSAVFDIELDAPEASDFIARHEQLVEEARDKLVGVLAFSEAAKDEQLKINFGPDYGRLSDEQKDVLTQPTQEEISELRDAFLIERTVLRAVKALDSQRQIKEQTEGEEILPHQQEVLDDILSFLSSSKKEGHVELATATGKTYLIAKLADAFATAGLRTLLLAPTKQIATQIIGDDGKKGLGKFASPETNQKIGRQFGGDKAKASDPVVVSTYQSLNRFVDDKKLGEFDIVLCDEAHRALGDVTSNNIRKVYPHAIKLGFTATPNFGANKSVSQILPETIHSINLREAIVDGLASKVQCLVFSTGEEVKVRDPYHQDFTDRELRRLINLKSRNEKALQFAQDFVQSGRQGIIACVPGQEIAHARLLADELNNLDIVDDQTGEKRKIIALAISPAIMTDQEQQEALAKYEAGEIDVLTFVSVLGEGWDSQRASFIINACPTTSIVKITQQIGRVVRKKEDGNHAIVVDFVDEIAGKEQKTALHSLGEEKIELTTIYGSYEPHGGERERTTYLRGILSSDLYNQLLSVDGHLVAELTISNKEREYRRALEYYERVLRKEGLYTDTHLFGIPVDALEDIEQAEFDFIVEFDRQPSLDDLLERIDAQKHFGRTTSAHKLRERLELALRFRHFDLRGTMIGNTEVADDIYDMTYGDPQEVVAADSLSRDLAKALSPLGPRERDILLLHNGFKDGELLSYEQIGDYLSISRGRVAQIRSKALSDIRYSSSRSSLQIHLGDPDSRTYSGELSDNASRLNVMKSLGNEPVSLQALFINVLSPNERIRLMKDHRHALPLVVQDYLAQVIEIEKKSQYANSLSPEGQRVTSKYLYFKRLMDGTYNDYLPFMPLEDREPVSSLIEGIPTELLRDRDAVPESLSDLMTNVADIDKAQNFMEQLSNLQFSHNIANFVLDLHEQKSKIDPKHTIPNKKDIATYFFGRQAGGQSYSINVLAGRWKLPEVVGFGRTLLGDRWYSSEYGLAQQYNAVLIQGGHVLSFLKDFKLST